LLLHLDRIAEKAWESGYLLDEHLATEEDELSRERTLSANIRRFEAVDSTIDLVSRGILPSEDLALMEALSDYRDKVRPTISDLAGLENLSPGNKVLREGLAKLGQAVEDIANKLRGEKR
jgi:hypothetical protein